MTAPSMNSASSGEAAGPIGVVLIHGLARSTGSMWLLSQRLRRAGFITARVGYPSTRLPVDASVEHVAAAIRRVTQGWRVIHLVGHSLGGVIARIVAERHPELPIGRIVQLGAPNAGSALAETVSRLPGARSVLGPALDDIPRLHSSGPPRPEVGAIAGRLPIDLPGDPFGLKGPNDGFVTVRSAWDGAAARLAIPSVHGWMPLSPAIGRQVVRFLKEGRFEETGE